MSFYFYAETAFHHEGNKSYLLKLIDEAKKSGVQGVKFQVLIELQEFMSSKHSAYEDAKSWILSYKDWQEIFQYTTTLGLDIILMPLDVKAFEFCKEFNVMYIEIHSVSFRDERLLSKLGDANVPLIFGIGGRTIEEIDFIVKKYHNKEIILMVGFQSYPSDLKDMKLERISNLKELYPQCKVGYADHSSYKSKMSTISNEYAYILGARFFEKHITLEEGLERVDYQSAVSCEKIQNIKKSLDYLESILNINPQDLFNMNEKEVMYRSRQKSPVANRVIEAGEVISSDLLKLKMTDQLNIIDSVDGVIGKKSYRNIEKDSAFNILDFL